MTRVDALLGFLAAGLLRGLAATWRIELRGRPDLASTLTHEGEAIVGALWHRNLLLAAGVFRDLPVHVPVSRSRDGDRIAAVMRWLGFPEPPRGSSTRGGASVLRTLLRRARGGQTVVVLADGPRGPARRVKHGVVSLASKTQRPLCLIAMSAAPAIRFSSWDGMLLPLPFSRVVCQVGDAKKLSAPLARDKRAHAASLIDSGLDALTDLLDTELGRR